MTSPITIVLILLLPVLLVGSAFFSAAETALFGLSRHQRRQLHRDGGLVGNAIQILFKETRGLLITMMLGNMTVNVAYFVVGTVVLLDLTHEHGMKAWTVSIVSVTQLAMIILFGEVIPKLYAAQDSMRVARMASLPLLAVHRIVGPIRAALSLLVITPASLLLAPSKAPAPLGSDELDALLAMSESHGLIDPGEERLLQQVLWLGSVKVRDIMVPRVDLVAYNRTDPPSRLIDAFIDTGLTRIPVFAGHLDNIEGIALAREVLLRRPQNAAELKPLVRTAIFVPELQRADQLLLHFRKTGTTVAIAVDEYGGTAGLVTLEDVVEQLVGKIPGPFESATAPKVTMLALGVWRVNADLAVDDWSEAFGARARNPGVSTVGGLVMARLGRLPRVGDRVRLGNLSLEVERMDGRRIESMVLRLESEEVGAPTSAGGQR